MSRFVLFNGAKLVRPGAATKIDASQFQNTVLDGVGIVGLVGEGESGTPRTIQVFNSAGGVKDFYRSGDLVEAAQIAALPENDDRLTSGASTFVCYKVNNSTAATLTAGSPTTITFTSLLHGLLSNNNTITISDGGSSTRIITLTTTDLYGNVITETSPALGGTGKFAIQYVGAGSAATITITSTQLTTSVTGAPADNQTFLFSNYKNLNDIIIALAQTGKYTCSALITNAISFDPSNLDGITTVDIKTSLTTIYARNFDIVDYVNTTSQIATAVLVKGQVSPISVLSTTAMSGGTRGTSANIDWANAFIALRTTRINQLVPLVSTDALTAQGTFTFASIAAAFAAHCSFVSSTKGRNECQGWYGMHATKANLIAEANLRNNMDLVLSGQQGTFPRTYDGALTVFPEWGIAAAMAGARAGAPLGEPLTWKYLNILGVTQDASWSESNNDDVESLELNGVVVVNNIVGKGFRIDKCITTFTRFDNDAYTEETIVQIWKAFAFTLRSALEDRYTGARGDLVTINTVPNTMVNVAEQFLDARAITPSSVNGTTTPAYRNIKYSLQGDKLFSSITISPTPGINYECATIALVPAAFSAAV